MSQLNHSLKKIGKIFKLQKELLKTERNHDEINAYIWRDKKDEWLDYVEKDVFCTAFSNAWYCKTMVEINGFLMKKKFKLAWIRMERF